MRFLQPELGVFEPECIFEMGSELPQISGKELGRVLTRLGFSFRNQKGSHLKFIRVIAGLKEVIVVPNHRAIRKGTLLGIIKRLNLDIESFKELL